MGVLISNKIKQVVRMFWVVYVLFLKSRHNLGDETPHSRDLAGPLGRTVFLGRWEVELGESDQQEQMMGTLANLQLG